MPSEIHRMLFFLLFVTITKQIEAFDQDRACGVTMGCFDDCEDRTSCNFLVSWMARNTSVAFTIKTKLDTSSDQWIAFGLTPTQSMNDASVSSCIMNNLGSTFTFENSYNPDGSSNDVVAKPKDGLSGLLASYKDGVVTCAFTRTNYNQDPHVFDLTKDYYMIYARGPMSAGFKLKHHHKATSARKIDLQSHTEEKQGASSRIKAHGSIAIIAWMLFMNIGTIITRYFKPLLPHRQVLGGAVWFMVHRVFMGTGALLTLIAFCIIIHRNLKIGTSTFENSHPVLGIFVFCIVFINPTVGILRPDKDSKFRPAFYLAHWLLGLIVSILGSVNIYIGINLQRAAVSHVAVPVFIVHEVLKVLFIVVFEGLFIKEKMIYKEDERYQLNNSLYFSFDDFLKLKNSLDTFIQNSISKC